MFEGLYFEYPKFFTLVAIYIACEAYCKPRSSALYFPKAQQFTRETADMSTLMWLLKWLSIALLTLAMMSPVKDAPLLLDRGEGVDIALVIDASLSMKTQHFDDDAPTRSRFDAVKSIASDFAASRQDDQLGLVLFGDNAFVASPLTFDKKMFTTLIAHLEPGMAGRSTAIYSAVAQAVNLLRNSPTKSRVAILLSDGHNTAGQQIPLAAAIALAKKENIRFYTIGIGGENGYDAALLGYIAEMSGGQSYGASNAKELAKVYAEIDRLEKSTIEHLDYTFRDYFYIYPLFLAFFTLLIYVYLRNRRGGL